MDKLLTYYNEIMNTTFGRLAWAIVVSMGVYFLLDLIFKVIKKTLPKELSSKLSKLGNPSNPIFKFIVTVCKFFVFIVILLLTLDYLGVKVVSLLAGLGIGGLAIAFAAQKVLGDLFTYVLIKINKPFEVGHRISFGTINGIVEKIGIKTTWIDPEGIGERIIVSNSSLLEGQVTNFKEYKNRRIIFGINVSNQTSKENLREVVAIVKGIIEKQSDTIFKRGHLKSFSAGAVEYEFAFDVPRTEYMNIQEKIYLDILDAFAEKNITMAYPAQKVLLEKT
ncbi:MAG: mechanosensitive ion channel family protein [Fibromonadaceae bacterium]|jgi:small-conductance mechanosensitive channel|nr:mechanosensitive ion channel family protein [Fibromonadaceae bacterium]